jgi:YVTN family beta-propeller protein
MTKQSLRKRLNNQSSFTTICKPSDAGTPHQLLHRTIWQYLSIVSFLLLSMGVGTTTAQAQSFAYVANNGFDTVSVIDTATNTVVTTIPVGVNPEGVAITPDGTRAYVTNNTSNTVSVIDTTTNTVFATIIPFGPGPSGVAITPDGTRAYVTSDRSDAVSVIHTATNAVFATILVGLGPSGVAITPDGTRAYVTNRNSSTVSVISTSTNAVVATISSTEFFSPVGVAITPDGTRAYVANDGSGTVVVIDTSTNTVVTTITVGFGSFGVAITPDGTRAYVTNAFSSTVSVIDTSTNTVVVTISAGLQPVGVAITPDGTRAYVTNNGSNTVTVINTSTNTPGAIISVGGGPFGVAITPLRADAPITATGTTFGATEGVTFTGTVATFSDPDPASTAGEYSATIDWGDSTPTTPGTISGPTGGPFTVSGTHMYAEQGTYAVTVVITDIDTPSNTATAHSTAKVSDAKLSSTCATMPVSTQTYTGPTAIFTDQSSTGTLSDFSATIDWGDGSSSAGTIIGGPGNAPYTVSGTHTYASTGTFLISTMIADVGGSTTTTPACSVTIFAFATGNGATFVIGDLEAGLGNHVTWWSSQWAKINLMSGGPPPSSMKKGFAGFEDNFLGLPPPDCGGSWSTDTGNSTPPPASVPKFMGVIVSSMLTQSGSMISGDIKQVVIVRTDPGYAPDPGATGTGTEIAIVCSLP